jgi:hypothetical protein
MWHIWEDKINARWVLVGEREGKEPLRSYRHKLGIILKMDCRGI